MPAVSSNEHFGSQMDSLLVAYEQDHNDELALGIAVDAFNRGRDDLAE